MANENTASYARIGFAVVIGVVAIIATLVWLGGLGSGSDLIYAETYCDRSVSGLSTGSAVNFRGVKIGEVKRIGFVGDEYEVYGETNQMVYILMAFPRNRGGSRDFNGDGLSDGRSLDGERMLQKLVDKYGARATVTASGITGLSRIELNYSSEPALKISWKPRHCYVPAGISLLDNFSDSATKVMNQINHMDIGGAWSNISASVRALARATESAQLIIESRQADVEKMTTGLSETVSSARDFADELKTNPSLLIRERRPEPLPETSRR